MTLAKAAAWYVSACLHEQQLAAWQVLFDVASTRSALQCNAILHHNLTFTRSHSRPSIPCLQSFHCWLPLISQDTLGILSLPWWLPLIIQDSLPVLPPACWQQLTSQSSIAVLSLACWQEHAVLSRHDHFDERWTTRGPLSVLTQYPWA